MNWSEIAEIVTNECGSIVYIADANTYELLYFNSEAKKQFNIEEHDDSYQYKKCHKLLQGKDAPCKFCTNPLLNEHTFYNWDFTNPMLGKHYYVRDKIVIIDGRKCRLEIADVATERVEAKRQLEEKLETETTLVNCIKTLSAREKASEAIQELLQIVAEFYQGDRGYLFEIDYEAGEISNTYEWVAEGITAEIGNLQHLPLSYMDKWMEQFKKNGEFYFTDLEQYAPRESGEYSTLVAQAIHSLIAAPLWKDGKVDGFIGVDNPRRNNRNRILLTSVTYFIQDDIQKRKSMKMLENLSFRDSLTGLFNRTKYKQILANVENVSPDSVGIVYMDLNGLKAVNDTWGHQYGDDLIIQASRFQREVFGDDVYRVGGDEFVVICRNITYSAMSEKIEQLRSLMKGANISMSFGSSYCDADINLPEQVSRADKDMYREKQAFYAENLSLMQNEQGQEQEQLRDALASGQFVVYFQPVADLITEQIIEAEALVRKNGEGENLLPPDRFLPQYEENGSISQIDMFVFEEACRAMHRWQKYTKDAIRIMVNFSRSTLLEKDIEKKLLSICSKYSIKPSRLQLEITDKSGNVRLEDLIAAGEQLHRSGFRLSLDDFGSINGERSLLSAIPFNAVKLDRVFAESAEDSASREAIRQAIRLCKDIKGVDCIPKGIETEKQLEMFLRLGCRYGQGYLFAAPMPLKQFELQFITPGPTKLNV